MRETHVNKLVLGTLWLECPRCGFDFLKSEMIEDAPTGTLMCKWCADKSNPYDNH